MVRKHPNCEPVKKKSKPVTLKQLALQVKDMAATLADVQNDLTQAQADIEILKSKPATGLVTQAELDGLKDQTGKILTDLNALVTPPTP